VRLGEKIRAERYDQKRSVFNVDGESGVTKEVSIAAINQVL
jgi:hypothetical protein